MPSSRARTCARSSGSPRPAPGDAVQIIPADFEELDPGDGKVFDVVAAANSFHWIAASCAFKKVSEFLRDDGVLLLLWHFQVLGTAVRESFNDFYRNSLPQFVVDDDYFAQRTDSLADGLTEIEESGFFDRVVTIQLWEDSEISVDRYQAMLTSYGDLACLAPQARAEILDEVARHADRIGYSHLPLRNMNIIRLARRTRCPAAG
jgi:SAM-dependent methyltransferase